jgi:hypothetical protein
MNQIMEEIKELRKLSTWKERFINFWKDPNCKLKILALAMSIALIYDALYFNTEISDFKKQFTFFSCMTLYKYQKDENGNLILKDNSKEPITLIINSTNFTKLNITVNK